MDKQTDFPKYTTVNAHSDNIMTPKPNITISLLSFIR